MTSYKMLLALLLTLAVPAFTHSSEVHAMQVQLEDPDLPTEFGSFEVCLNGYWYGNQSLYVVSSFHYKRYLRSANHG